MSVSAVIPSFNRQAETVRAIRSALGQSYPPTEVIVVDDGSDIPVDVSMFRASAVPVRLIRQANAGGGAARNAGIDASTAKWIAFLDSDDTWTRDKLAIQLGRLSSPRGHNFRAAACNVLLRQPGRHDAPYNQGGPGEADLASWLLSGAGTFQTSGIMVQTELAKEVRFREDLRRHQDWDFVLRLAQNGTQFDYCDACLVDYYTPNDPTRISINPSPSSTLYWLDTTDLKLPAYEVFDYYLYSFASGHFRDSPLHCFRTLRRLSQADRRNYTVLLRYVAHLLKREVRLRSARR